MTKQSLTMFCAMKKRVKAAIATARKVLGYFDKYISLRFDVEPFLTLEVDAPPGYTLCYEPVKTKSFQAAIGNVHN